MGALSDILATIPGESWIMFALVAGCVTTAALWPHARYAYLKSRFDRRLARDGFMLREEANERRLAMGEEPKPLNGWRLPTAALATGLIAAIPPWLASLGHPHWWEVVTLTVEGGTILAALWHRLNDPEPKPLWPDVHFPRESIVGFVSALAIVAVMLGVMLKFM